MKLLPCLTESVRQRKKICLGVFIGPLFFYFFTVRLEILYQRNLFKDSITLAQKSGMDTQQQNVIYRKYGDFLYQKADYDGAMEQYLKAIDNTEPSQVIRKV